MGAPAGPLAAQREQGVRQCVHRGLGRADVHKAQPAAAHHDGVQLPVDVGELEQVGRAELAEQVGRTEGLGLGGTRRRGAQDPLADRGLEQAALPYQRGRRGPAVQGGVQAGGHVTQRGQISHQVAVGGRADGGDPEHGAPPALAPFQEQPGVTPAHRVLQGHVRQRRAVGGGQRAQFGGAESLQVQVEQIQAAVAGSQHAPPALLGLAPGRLGQPADAAGAQRTPVPGVCGGPQVADGLVMLTAGQGDPAGQKVGIDGPRRIEGVQPGRHPAGRLKQGRRRILALREPAAEQDELGARRPPRALLPPEQPQRFGAVLLREAGLAAAAATAEEYSSSARLVGEP